MYQNKHEENGYDNEPDTDMKQDKNMKHVAKPNEKDKECIRLICISDTHNMHKGLTAELINLYESENDILLHAGDVSESGTLSEFKSIDKWFGKLPYKHIYMISGNMDGMGLDKDEIGYGNIDGHDIFKNATYLEHEFCEIKLKNKLNTTLKLFGSPYTPKFFGGFQIDNDQHGKYLWSQVPSNIDILLTHGPPKGILDQTSSGYSVGDTVLRGEISNRIKPKVAVFGHVHPSNNVLHDKKNNILYANVAMHDKLAGMDKAKHHHCTVIQIHIPLLVV